MNTQGVSASVLLLGVNWPNKEVCDQVTLIVQKLCEERDSLYSKAGQSSLSLRDYFAAHIEWQEAMYCCAGVNLNDLKNRSIDEYIRNIQASRYKIADAMLEQSHKR